MEKSRFCMFAKPGFIASFVVIVITVRTLRIVKVVGFPAIGTLLLRKVTMGVTVQLTFGQSGAIKFNLAAIGTAIDLQFQRAGKEMGQIAEDQARFSQLEFFPTKAIHRCSTTKTIQLLHQAFSTAATAPAIASVFTVSMRPLS